MYNPEERERVCTLARKNTPALGRGTGRGCELGYGDAGFGVTGLRGTGLCASPAASSNRPVWVVDRFAVCSETGLLFFGLWGERWGISSPKPLA